MSVKENLTADLFEVDKRLSLKPVVDFNQYLQSAFGDGPCICSRCDLSSGDESAYAHPHTFSFDGKPVNRRFAVTSASDVLMALKKAWLSYTKEELLAAGVLELDTVKAFVEPQLHQRLKPLLIASGLVKEIDGHLIIQAEAVA